MKFQSKLPKRKPSRLKDYDYSTPGAYFITLCTHNRKQLLSKIVGAIISKVIGYLKMNASKQVRLTCPEKNIWQRGSHDHIIRDKNDYQKIWKYIDTNVIRWKDDCFYAKRGCKKSPERKKATIIQN